MNPKDNYVKCLLFADNSLIFFAFSILPLREETILGKLFPNLPNSISKRSRSAPQKEFGNTGSGRREQRKC